MARADLGQVTILSSEIAQAEIAAMPDPERRRRVQMVVNPVDWLREQPDAPDAR